MKREREQALGGNSIERAAPPEQQEVPQETVSERPQPSKDITERQKRLVELDRELKTADASRLSPKTSTAQAREIFREHRGEWVQARFGPQVRHELALRELGADATALRIGLFRARRALRLLPRGQRERLAKEELVLLDNLAERWEREHLPQSPTVDEVEEKPLAMRLAAPHPISEARTMGEHDAENERRLQQQ